jgi:TolA-binding protein
MNGRFLNMLSMYSALAGKNHSKNAPDQFSPIIVFFVTLFIALFCGRISAQDKSESKYYSRLLSQDFMKMMIPKEKFLLGIVKNVTDELAERRREGETAAELGIDEIRSPKDALIHDYDSELRAMESLILQIESLELQAKRRVDMDVLGSLEQLKERLKTFLTAEIKILDEQAKEQTAQMHRDEADFQLSGKPLNLNLLQDPFGEATLASGDLFEQWKFNRLLDYKLRLARYEFYRQKLRKNANPVQAKRMFQRDLQQALLAYNNGDFQLARLQLQDVLDQYASSYVLDDVMYYRCESAYALNYLDEALEGYQQLAATYPNSEFTAKGLIKQVYIYYIYSDVSNQVEVFQRLLIRKNQIYPGTWGIMTYLVGYSQFKSGQFRNALETLRHIQTGTSYYYPSHYLSAACYSNLGDNESAIAIYQQLIEQISGTKNPMLNQIKNNALLKLGLIYYEDGQTNLAREYFNQVRMGSSSYDLSLLGNAWAAYQEGKPAEALQTVEELLSNSLISNYIYEARVLAASSKELLGQKEAALDDLKRVANLDKLSAGQPFSPPMVDPVQFEKEKILYREAKRIQKFLRGVDTETVRLDRADQTEFAGTQQQLQGEIENLDDLEVLAKEKNQPSLSKIRQIRSQMIETLQDHTLEGRAAETGRDDSPLIRQMGMTEYLKYLFRALLLETLSEKDQTKLDIETAVQLKKEANEASQFNISLHMEMKQEELEDYYDALNQYEVWLKENLPQEFNVEVDQWTSFSSYGISNINFNRIKEIDEQTAQIARIMASIDRVFQDKRINLEERIQGLLSDVARIEAQMKVETNRRLERERESFFHNKYFNKQTKETVVQ